MSKYYIYLHIKLTNGEPFYVGKGCERRYKRSNSRSNWWNNIVNKYGFDVIMLEEGLSEIEAFDKERYWINRIGRRDLGKGPLINHTDGGEGTSGHKPWNKDKVCPQFAGEKNYFYGKNKGKKGENHPFYGKNHTNESKTKTSKKLKERYKTIEHHLKGKPAHNKKKVIYNGIEFDSIKSLLESKIITRAQYYKNV